MSHLLSTVIPLAIGAAISPQVLAISVIVLGGKKSPRTNTAIMLCGMFAVLVAITAVAAGSMSQVPKAQGSTYLVYWLDVALGVVLLYLGGRNLAKKPDPNAPAKTVKQRGGANAGPAKFLLLGCIVMATDFSSIVLFIPGIRDVSVASVDLLEKVLAGSILYIAVLAPALIPWLATIISPEKAGRTMVTIHDWLKAHTQAINIALCFIFGAFLIYKGLSKLV
jgi:threonine/homoserine/homoserine lactone efflux protein